MLCWHLLKTPGPIPSSGAPLPCPPWVSLSDATPSSERLQSCKMLHGSFLCSVLVRILKKITWLKKKKRKINVVRTMVYQAKPLPCCWPLLSGVSVPVTPLLIQLLTGGPGKQQRMAYDPGTLHVHGRPGRSSRLLAMHWPSSGLCSYLESELVE